MAKNMTQGNLVGILVQFSLPLILSGLLQQLFSWADAFIVGNIEGESALAAVGAAGTISNLFLMVITGLSLGLSILSAQQYGRGDTEELKKDLSSFGIVLGVIFLVMGALGICLSDLILQLLQTPDDIFEISKKYLRIIFAGLPFVTVYNVYSSVLRGIGDSKVSFMSVFISSVLNVLLDILFVSIFRYGVEGAAAATVISQILMTAFTILYAVKKYKMLKFQFDRNMIDKTVLKQGLSLGLPVAVQSSISSFGSLFLQNVMNSFGTQTVAAITTAYRVDSILILPIINLGSGISTAVAQNIGAGKHRRAKKVFFVGMIIMFIVSTVLAMLLLAVGGDLIAMFGVTGDALLIGTDFFHIVSCFYVIYGMAMAIRGFLEGTGDVLFSSIAGGISLVMRIIMCYSLASKCGNKIIAYAVNFSWGSLFLMYFFRFMWKRKYFLNDLITEKICKKI